MSARISARIAAVAATAFATVVAAAVAAAPAGAEVVYSNAPSPLPGNFASIGLDATSTSEFGGAIELAGTARSKPKITVVMSSWACQTGGWTEHNCSTPKPTKGFKVPLTVRVYQASELAEGPVAERTKEVKMLYRPSASAECTEGRWYDAAEKTCYNGYAFPVTVPLPKLKKMPRNAIVTFSYPHSSGPATSLNISISEPSEKTLSIGANPTEELFLNSNWSEMYCPGSPNVGKFAGTGSCGWWEGDQPVISVSAE